MADRIIKPDSGNDVVIQNNGGTRKIEVTNAGDVEVTGDFKATTVKATNLKANDGTASLEIADSTGDIGFSTNTNLKIKLPSAGGIYESDGSTQVLTESGGSVTIQNATFDGIIGSNATLSGGYLSGSKFDVTFYEAGSASATAEVWYKVPTECQLVDFTISGYHSTSHTAIAAVYTSASAGTETTNVWYREQAYTSGWQTWVTANGTTNNLPVNLGGSGEHTFVGVRTTSANAHTYWTLVTTTLTFQVD